MRFIADILHLKTVTAKLVAGDSDVLFLFLIKIPNPKIAKFSDTENLLVDHLSNPMRNAEEASNYLNYLLLVSVVAIVAYLVFHNKQKVCIWRLKFLAQHLIFNPHPHLSVGYGVTSFHRPLASLQPTAYRSPFYSLSTATGSNPTQGSILNLLKKIILSIVG